MVRSSLLFVHRTVRITVSLPMNRNMFVMRWSPTKRYRNGLGMRHQVAQRSTDISIRKRTRISHRGALSVLPRLLFFFWTKTFFNQSDACVSFDSLVVLLFCRIWPMPKTMGRNRATYLSFEGFGNCENLLRRRKRKWNFLTLVLDKYKSTRLRSIFTSLNEQACSCTAVRGTYAKIDLDLSKLSEHCSKWRKQLFDAQASMMANAAETDDAVCVMRDIANEINSVAAALDDSHAKLTSSKFCIIC